MIPRLPNDRRVDGSHGSSGIAPVERSTQFTGVSKRNRPENEEWEDFHVRKGPSVFTKTLAIVSHRSHYIAWVKRFYWNGGAIRRGSWVTTQRGGADPGFRGCGDTMVPKTPYSIIDRSYEWCSLKPSLHLSNSHKHPTVRAVARDKRQSDDRLNQPSAAVLG
jgi:hypothetical protein